MSVKIFLSTVSDEFRAYRDQLRGDLTRQNVEVKVQEDFKDQGDGTLTLLDTYIANCDAVVHLVGEMTGSAPGAHDLTAFRAKYPDLESKLPPLGKALREGAGVPYTQWEAWLALYHGKKLFIAAAADGAARGPKFQATDASRAAQAAHLARLRAMDRHPSCTFTSPDNLAKQILGTAILDLLVRAEVEAFAEKEGRARAVAEGFIHEMARKVAGDPNLDIEGKQEAVRNAIEIYCKEIAGAPSAPNFDAIVGEALNRAKALVDEGKSGLARASLRKASEALRRDEDDRRERYVAEITALYNRERDIALAAYEGEGAADAILALADALHGDDAGRTVSFLDAEAEALYDYGRDRGSNVYLVAAIALRRRLLALATSADARGAAHNNLGVALATLGERESGTARLNEAAATFRAALKETTRDRVPLQWAGTQNNLGNTLQTLGKRESGSTRLNEAVAAYRGALKEYTRERVPLDWAMTQMNLGNALSALGERDSGTARLNEAVAAFSEALKEYTRERAPLEWAGTQNNLGSVLRTLGARESGTLRLEEAVAAFRESLREYTRERVPLDWAMTQTNLGNALAMLGERESGSTRLIEALAAYREALKERTRERIPLDWAMTQMNLGSALSMLGARESGTARLEEAVAAYRETLKEFTRERVPLQWAATQNNLGNALQTLGGLESGTARLNEAVAAFREALKERMRERVPLQWAMTQNNLGNALSALGARETGTVQLNEAVAAYREALKERKRERVPLDWAMTQNNLGTALQTLGERECGTARLDEAVGAYREALKERTRERVPLQWAGTQMNLGNALALLTERQQRPAILTEALAAMRNALEVYRQAGDSYRLPIAQRRVGELQEKLDAWKTSPP